MIHKDKIEELLRAALNVSHMTIIDESHLHAGHAEAQKNGGGHFKLIIVSDDFTGKTPIERHKMIYKILKSELKNDIHALTIKAYTKAEHT